MEAVDCGHCNGSGREFASMDLTTGERQYRTCSVCNGTGKVAAEKSHFTRYPDLSLKYALQLMQRHGKPVEVRIVRDHDIRVLSKDGSRYVLGGFTVGYRGTGPDYTKRFLDAAGFSVTIDEIAEMKPMEGEPIILVAGQPYIPRQTLTSEGSSVEEAKKTALESVSPDAKVISLEVVHDGTTPRTVTGWGDSEEAAFENAKEGLPEGTIIEEKKVEDLSIEGVKGEGVSENAAFEDANSRLPDGVAVEQKEVLQAGSQGTVVVEAFTDWGARGEAKRLPPEQRVLEGGRITSVECIRQPRLGFIGIGKKAGAYKVSWQSVWKVQLAYRPKRVRLTYRPKPTVRVTFQPSSK